MQILYYVLRRRHIHTEYTISNMHKHLLRKYQSSRNQLKSIFSVDDIEMIKMNLTFFFLFSLSLTVQIRYN